MSGCGPVRKRKEAILRFASVRDQEHLSPRPATLRGTKWKRGSRGEGCYGGGSRAEGVVPGESEMPHSSRMRPGRYNQSSLGAARVPSARHLVGTGERCPLEDEAVSADLLETKRILCPESTVAQCVGGLRWIWRMSGSIWGQEVISAPSRRAAPRQERAFGTRGEEAHCDTHSHPGGVLGQHVGSEALCP